MRHSTTLRQCVDRILPTDREFSTTDVMEALTEFGEWSQKIVANYLCQLRRQGVIRRTRRQAHNRPAHYVRADVAIVRRPFDDLQLVDVAAIVLGDQAMTATELVVAILEAGFQTDSTPHRLRNKIVSVMKGQPARFRIVGDEWRTG